MFKDRNALAAVLDLFYGDVANRIEQFQKERRGFTVFDYIDPNENRLSDVIHDLLDPSGKHGQGRLFLDLFLDAIGVKHESVHPIPRVKREDCAWYSANPQRRIDITVDFGEFGIGIENKPFAYEGPNQLKDYCIHLRRKYRRFMLVYLLGDGSRPTSLSKTELVKLLAENSFKKLDYRTGVYHWLERCGQECKAEKVRWFLQDFAEYVSRNPRFEPSKPDEEPIDDAE